MLNPITYTDHVARDFLRYQSTTHNFADPDLDAQMRRLLRMEETRETPLMKGPYVSLSRLFERGARVDRLGEEGLLHPELVDRIPFERLYDHQEQAIRSIAEERPTLLSTGTGSGKTEAFLYPIVSRCLELRDQDADPGLVSVLVYPMNALAQDQLERIRHLLAGTGVSFGLYIGKTPESAAGAEGRRLEDGHTQAEYEQAVESSDVPVYPAEERISRETMRRKGQQPRILLTNVKQLELLLTRPRDGRLFDDARLEYVVLDEAHTFRGTMGAETAALIRRLRAYCGCDANDTVSIGTSATIADPESGAEEARNFMSRLFGVPSDEVAFVSEAYADKTWTDERYQPPPFEGDPLAYLEKILEALRQLDDTTAEPEHDDEYRAALDRLDTHVYALMDRSLERDRWRAHLFELLASNELVHQIAEHLEAAAPLDTLAEHLSEQMNRRVDEAEVLIWLALGAAARKDDRPLLRPVVHSFVRGVDGAVVTFPPEEGGEPTLWLSAADANEADDTLFQFEVMTCKTCGQHYFAHHVGGGFEFVGDDPGGGIVEGHRRLWPAEGEGEHSTRVALLDSLAFAKMGDLDQDPDEMTDKVSRVLACHRCGALHNHRGDGCADCGSEETLVELYAVQQKEERPGQLTSCVACKRSGRSYNGRYREPARPVRAVTVSDVHVVAQSMLQHAERERLLVFTDNRQDAAFQAGWMEDHAKRFRLRSLMYEHLDRGGVAVGDVAFRLEQQLDADRDLSKSLIPEVWRQVRPERSGQEHENERKTYLRIQLLRELTTSVRQRLGLETWGRLRVEYPALEGHSFFERWASEVGCTPERLRGGVEMWLDVTRRANVLYDPETRIFSKRLSEETNEVNKGYIPPVKGSPKGLKLRRDAKDDDGRIRQILTDSGHDTLATELVKAWGLPEDRVVAFWEDLWGVLTDDLDLLEPVTLKWPGGGAIDGCAGARQIHADHLELRKLDEGRLFRCTKCQRAYPRRTPREACPGWRCDGTLSHEEEPEDDYNLMLLDEQFTMVRPHEHSAQVPDERRDRIEQAFKGAGDSINTLVSTPTLELGVDIGALDATLMRNVPPLPANYWQRVGRAGRRHRMAVNITYARSTTHDRAYFEEPMKMLGGEIEPPSFNLKNEVMVRKHVHAATIGFLYRMARHDRSLTEDESQEIARVLDQSFPNYVRDYLFEEDGEIRSESFDLSPLEALIERYRPRILEHVAGLFEQQWPDDARSVVQSERLETYVDEMTEGLREVVGRLEDRRDWAHEQLTQLEERRHKKGVLNPKEERRRRRCRQLLAKLKGYDTGNDGAEGYDETYTYSVLAAEGYLPGYGLDSGGVTAHHLASGASADQNDWTVRRPPSLAVREFVPGNMIYANGHRYAPRYFQLEAEDAAHFQVDVDHEAVVDTSGSETRSLQQLSEASLDAVPVCDVELPHTSTISDDEEYRFQLPSAVYGYERDRHGPGKRYAWGAQTTEFRESVRLRLVNVGPSQLVQDRELGYPVCTICGGSRSPFGEESELENFYEWHEDNCGQRPERIGFFADIVADTLTWPDIVDRREGYSVVEALRHGAAQILEMELDDLQVLSIGQPGEEAVDMVLYDPMPGGSGLLEQMIERWDEVRDAALNVVEQCPSQCEEVCVDCLMTFRNMHYHRHLSRHVAAERLRDRSDHLEPQENIEAHLPDQEGSEASTSLDPTLLFRRMLDGLGFPEPVSGHALEIGHGQGTTEPDFYYPDVMSWEGYCVYIGEAEDEDEATRRMQLPQFGYQWIEVPAQAGASMNEMVTKLCQLAYALDRSDIADKIQGDEERLEAIRDRIEQTQCESAPETSEHDTDTHPEEDGWSFPTDIVGPAWSSLIEHLEATGLPEPDSVLEGIAVDGKVSDHKAIVTWEDGETRTSVVESETAEQVTFDDETDVVVADPDDDPESIASALESRLT